MVLIGGKIILLNCFLINFMEFIKENIISYIIEVVFIFKYKKICCGIKVKGIKEILTVFVTVFINIYKNILIILFISICWKLFW